MDINTPLVLSLFPGIGLLDMAFEAEGFCVVRGPDLLWGGDIRAFHPSVGKFDGVIGGPPCQAHSPLVNLKDSCDQYGDQIPEFERCVLEARPLWFLMENVRQAQIPEVNGYHVRDVLLNNRWFGEDQNRVRRFSFGTHGGASLLRYLDGFSALESPTWSACVTAAHGGERRTHFNKGTGGQGLPADFFARSPFRRDWQLKMVANGVPILMGRAIARAVRAAIGLPVREGAA